MADDKKNSGPAVLDVEHTLFELEANGVPVIRRAYDEKAKCPRCEYDSTINITEYAAQGAIFRVKSCGVCRHESKEGSAPPPPAPSPY